MKQERKYSNTSFEKIQNSLGEPISMAEFEKLIKSAPVEMRFPMYIGEVNGQAVFRDLAAMKSVAFCGPCGISARFCLSVWSMLAARNVEVWTYVPVITVPQVEFYPHTTNCLWSHKLFLDLLLGEYHRRKDIVAHGGLEQKLLQKPIVVLMSARHLLPTKSNSDTTKIWQRLTSRYKLSNSTEIFQEAHKYGIFIVCVDVFGVQQKFRGAFHTIVQYKDGDISYYKSVVEQEEQSPRQRAVKLSQYKHQNEAYQNMQDEDVFLMHDRECWLKSEDTVEKEICNYWWMAFDTQMEITTNRLQCWLKDILEQRNKVV